MKKLLVSLLGLTLFTAVEAQTSMQMSTELMDTYESTGTWIKAEQNTTKTKAKNIIVIIGDGMGTAQVSASVVAQKGKSNFQRFPYSGFSRTHSNNKYTTDSGAGGTAIVTGHKTDNNHVGALADGTPIKSILSYAKENGKATGFVVTSSVIDATPASTYAHVTHRKKYDSISMQLAHCGFDFMVGGGLSNFRIENRKDGLNPIDTLLRKGYTLSYSLEEMRKNNADKQVTFFCENYYGPVAPGRDPVLTEGTKKALEQLTKNKNGFALLIEGSQIDWACHNNDAPYMHEELKRFEEMLRIVLDFAERDGNTLVVVTADHETGGLVLLNGNIEEGNNECKYITDWHSGVMVPVFAYGPGASMFSGIQDNTELFPKMMSVMGFKK